MRDRGSAPTVGVIAIILATVLAFFGSATSASAAAASTGDVYIIHGLTGANADILVDGNSIGPASAPKTVVGPLRLSPGTHVVSFKNGTEDLVSAEFTVQAGTSSDVVAYRSADSARKPLVTVFANDVSAVRESMVRVVVTHVASAPPADIVVDGNPVLRNIANGETLTLDLPAKKSTISVVPTMTDGAAILEPFEADLQAQTLTRVFVIGQPGVDADAIVQVIQISGPAVEASPSPSASASPSAAASASASPAATTTQRPTKVQTGDGGQAAAAEAAGGFGAGSLVLLALLALGGLIALNRRGNPHPTIGSRHSR